MNIDLSGKTALVTGSTAGIGFAIAKGLAAEREGRARAAAGAPAGTQRGTGHAVRGWCAGAR